VEDAFHETADRAPRGLLTDPVDEDHRLAGRASQHEPESEQTCHRIEGPRAKNVQQGWLTSPRFSDEDLACVRRADHAVQLGG
jgi:hypothetical protein